MSERTLPKTAHADYGIERDGRAPRVYYGAIADNQRVSWWRSRVYWYCSHNHATPDDAQRCAQRRLQALARAAPVGQGTGDRDG